MSDVSKLLHRVAQLEREIRGMTERAVHAERIGVGWEKRAEKAEAEVARLREALEYIRDGKRPPPPAEQVKGPVVTGVCGCGHRLKDHGDDGICLIADCPCVVADEGECVGTAPPPSPAGASALGGSSQAESSVTASSLAEEAKASGGRETGPIGGVWRCAECGEEANANPIVGEWRWSGTHWEHHHGIQVGHVHARYFGPAPARRWAVKGHTEWLGLDGRWKDDVFLRALFPSSHDARRAARQFGGTVVEVDENGKEVKA